MVKATQNVETEETVIVDSNDTVSQKNINKTNKSKKTTGEKVTKPKKEPKLDENGNPIVKKPLERTEHFIALFSKGLLRNNTFILVKDDGKDIGYYYKILKQFYNSLDEKYELQCDVLYVKNSEDEFKNILQWCDDNANIQEDIRITYKSNPVDDENKIASSICIISSKTLTNVKNKIREITNCNFKKYPEYVRSYVSRPKKQTEGTPKQPKGQKTEVTETTETDAPKAKVVVSVSPKNKKSKDINDSDSDVDVINDSDSEEDIDDKEKNNKNTSKSKSIKPKKQQPPEQDDDDDDDQEQEEQDDDEDDGKKKNIKNISKSKSNKQEEQDEDDDSDEVFE